MDENNNVLITEIIAGLNQPEWGQTGTNDSALSPMTPERDSRVFVLGSFARPATTTTMTTRRQQQRRTNKQQH